MGSKERSRSRARAAAVERERAGPKERAGGVRARVDRLLGIELIKQRLTSPIFVVTALGCSIMCLLLFVPFWNSVHILHSDVMRRLIGDRVPKTIITGSVLMLVLYVVSVRLFFLYGKAEARREQNMLMVGNVFASLLGAMTLLMSLPAHNVGNWIKSQITGQCKHGQHVHDLYTTYQALSELRRTPACMAEQSVERCDGFNRTETAELLKSMEMDYKCSGWCVHPVPANVTESATAKAGAPAPHQRLRYVYPPTLFSTSNFESTCDGMAAQYVHYFLIDTGNGLYFEGVYLIFISIAIGFLKLIGFCTKHSIYRKPNWATSIGGDYGSMNSQLLSYRDKYATSGCA